MFRSNQLRWLWLSWLIVIIDQFSKIFALHHFHYLKPIEILPVFNLTLDFNKGAAFSFLQGANGWQVWFFSFVALVVSTVIFFMLKKMPRTKNLLAASLSLILGGAVGNLLDRLFHGVVVDFFSWHYKNYYFPTFNIADMSVCIGAVLFIIAMSREKGEVL